MQPTALMCVTEAATALGRAPKTVRHYVREGRLTAYRVAGGPLSITRESVEALLEAGRVGPRERPPVGQFTDPQGDIFSVPERAAA